MVEQWQGRRQAGYCILHQCTSMAISMGTWRDACTGTHSVGQMASSLPSASVQSSVSEALLGTCVPCIMVCSHMGE